MIKKSNLQIEKTFKINIINPNYGTLLINFYNKLDEIHRYYKNIQSFLKQQDVINKLKSARTMYYEFFISLFTIKNRSFIEHHLYNSNDVYRIRDLFNYRKKSHNRTSKITLFEGFLNEGKKVFQAQDKPLTKKLLIEQFSDEITNNDESLFKVINKHAPQYLFRKFILSLIKKNLIGEQLLSSSKKKIIKFLDYRESPRTSLILTLKGHNVTVYDIKGKYLSSIKSRFTLRKLNEKALEFTFWDSLPIINAKFDLIILRELLKHVKNHIKCLNNMNKETNILLGSFPFIKTNAIGEHLKESLEQEKKVQNWINQNWVRNNTFENNYIFRKKV